MAESGVDIDMEQVRKLFAKLSASGRKVVGRQILNQGGNETMATMKPLMPTKTGRMKNSVVMRFEGGDSVRVGPTVNYAKYVVGGTAPHPIFPRQKRALFWPGANHPVKSVQHPGTKANKYPTYTQHEMKIKIPRMAQRIIETHLRG